LEAESCQATQSKEDTRNSDERVQTIAALRRLRFTGPEIAEVLGMALSTVSGILTRIGMGKLGRLGLEPARRYERERPGELIHIDVKKLGRIQGGAGKRVRDGLRQHYNRTRTDAEGARRQTVGWEFVHIAIDDCTRLAYAEVLGDEKATTVVAFLRRVVAFFASHGMTVEQLLTDNGSGYRSFVRAIACRSLGIRHPRTRPRGAEATMMPGTLRGFESGASLSREMHPSELEPPAAKLKGPQPDTPAVDASSGVQRAQ
jgi:Integrase core domain